MKDSRAVPLPSGGLVRHANRADFAPINRLVTAVIAETYGHLFPGGAPPRDSSREGDWVAEIGGQIAGVARSEHDRVEDLWVSHKHRRHGLGSAPLIAVETEIARRGHGKARLRVVAENHPARRFYMVRDWFEAQEYPHERWGFSMVEMVKRLPSRPL